MANYQTDKLVKPAYKQVTYTVEQIDELKACMHPETGPEYFISNYIYIQHSTLGRQKLQLFPFQLELIKAYHNYRRSVNMVGRQTGKCLLADTEIKIRNKTTGEIQKITFGEFEKLIKIELGIE